MPRIARLSLTAAAVTLALSACGGGDDVATPTTSPTASSPSPSPSPSGSSTGSPAAEPTSGDAVARPVYYLMDTTNGPRLYREFASRPDTGDAARDALEVMFAGKPADPDYTSLWPAGSEVLSTTRDGDLLTVDLSREALSGQAGSGFEAVSVQQLLYTVTAADPAVQRVRLTFEGATEDTLWGHVSVSEPLSRGPEIENLGPIWILTPTEGGSVARGGEVGGVASVFEATVNWQWLQGDTVVAEGFSTATEGAPGRGDWTAPVDVPPGDYVLKAFESSAQDGSQTFVDTKTVTVTG